MISAWSDPTGDDEGLVRVLIVALLFVTPAIIPILASIPVRDPDIWWHLATGKWIIEHGHVPLIEPFSLVGAGEPAGKPWVAYSWLYEVGIHGLYAQFGLAGLFVYSVAASLALTGALYGLIRRQHTGFLLSAILTALVLLTTWRHQGVRTFLLTILFFTIELDVLMSVRRTRGPAALLLLPPLFLLWANLHIQFVYGLLVLFIAVAESGLDVVKPTGRFDIPKEGFNPRWIVAIAILSVSATFVTPYGWRIYVVVYEYATQAAPWQYLRELRSPEFRSPLDWIVLMLALSAAFALGLRRDLRPFPLLLLVACSLLSFRAMRDSWCVTVVAATLCAQAGPRRPLLAAAFDPRRAASCAAVVAAVILFAYTAKGVSERSLADTTAGKFPAAAVDFVKAGEYPGPLYNHFDWGGYLIWALPEHAVSMDGRTNVYGDELIRRSMSTWAGAPGWESDPALAQANLVIAETGAALTALLRGDRRLEKVFEDDLAVVFVRR